jgi:hypothetical protein
MHAYCVCGEKFFAEFTTCVCPRCGERITAILDFSGLDGYRNILDEALVRIRRSIGIHGDWAEYTPEQVFDAVMSEISEYCEAYFDGRVGDRHGQIDELKDVVTVAIKGIERLKCLQ